MEQDYWQLGYWRRIPVSMHWTVLIVFIWLYLFFGNLLATIIGAVAFFALLVAHEWGHVVVLRRRRIPIVSIELYGIHGRTTYGLASTVDEIIVAWGGVGAQVAILLLALAVGYSLDKSTSPIVLSVLGPILFVFTTLNVVLMIVVLLPIGPFDGHNAWAVIPWIRGAIRRRRRAAKERISSPEKSLSADKRHELEESSAKAAEELMQKFARKGDGRKEDA